MTMSPVAVALIAFVVGVAGLSLSYLAQIGAARHSRGRRPARPFIVGASKQG